MKESLKKKDAENAIKRIKDELGSRLIILTHHYQKKEIVDLGDHKGDSFDLSCKAANDRHAEFIVFCGVHFMAESAAILAAPRQTVQIPDMNAGCWMADMADAVLVDRAWRQVTGLVGEKSITPLAYMNCDALIKAHCGRHNGAVCTSSNAPVAFEWAFGRTEKIFFFPDEHLGRNTGDRMGIDDARMVVWDPEKPLGGLTETEIKDAAVILWKGHCLVHTRFTTGMIEKMRRRRPEAKIVVHPECTREVVGKADAAGSTSFIVDYTASAPEGAVIAIGTEINLVRRLAFEHPDKTILPLMDSLCPNMNKISLEKLLLTLEEPGRKNVVTIDEGIRKEASAALENMLSFQKK